jgi:hypothetical protein
MEKEGQQGFQSSFLKPPVHDMEAFVAFELPELTHTITPKKAIERTLWEKNFWHELKPTPKQIIYIAKKSSILGMPEPQVSNRMEARDLIYELRGKLRARSKSKIKKSLKQGLYSRKFLSGK